jgi:hypothetical protein
MIVWINGAFGAGKTSPVENLAPRLPNSMEFDPELVGFLLRRIVPDAPTGDFQDLPIWRSLVARTATELRRHYGKHLIVPMTLVNRVYLDEIFGELGDEDIHHFFLRVSPEVLRRRLTDRVLSPADPVADEKARQWGLAQVDRCVAGMATMPADTELLDAETHSPEELAGQVLKHLGF